MNLSDNILFPNGYLLEQVKLPTEINHYIQTQDWTKLDQLFHHLLRPNQFLHHLLSRYHSFNQIEHIISWRKSSDPDEEDGIWHDDGSRSLAFSLSLNHKLPEGGELGIRKKGDINKILLPTQPYGTMIIFLTGKYGFEHKTYRVRKGERLVIAGWCSH